MMLLPVPARAQSGSACAQSVLTPVEAERFASQPWRVAPAGLFSPQAGRHQDKYNSKTAAAAPKKHVISWDTVWDHSGHRRHRRRRHSAALSHVGGDGEGEVDAVDEEEEGAQRARDDELRGEADGEEEEEA